MIIDYLAHQREFLGEGMFQAGPGGSIFRAEVFKALGFEPIAADIKRFVAEIGGDSFDAHDNPLTNVYTFGVHRYHRHVTLTSHFFGATFLIANAREYASWPAEVRDAVDQNGYSLFRIGLSLSEIPKS